MKTVVRAAVFAGLVAGSSACAMAGQAGAENTAETALRRGAAKLIDEVAADKTADAGVLRRTAEAVMAAVPDNVLAAEMLREAMSAEPADAERLRTALRRAGAMLAFKPMMEAPLPEGFPPPTPVGEIRVRRYPAYRLARTASKRENDSFMTLFNHIKKNEIAMTAPVEMTYGGKRGEAPRAEAMAFLYQNMRLGEVGRDAKVEVADVAEMAAVSLGLSGSMSPARIAEARGRLEKWLEAHPEFAADGPVRVLGYNSPFVLPWMRYFEVQIPVRTRSAAQGG